MKETKIPNEIKDVKKQVLGWPNAGKMNNIVHKDLISLVGSEIVFDITNIRVVNQDVK